MRQAGQVEDSHEPRLRSNAAPTVERADDHYARAGSRSDPPGGQEDVDSGSRPRRGGVGDDRRAAKPSERPVPIPLSIPPDFLAHYVRVPCGGTSRAWISVSARVVADTTSRGRRV